MPCFKPLSGYRSRTKTKNGKRKIVFSSSEGFVDRPQTIPCGQCIGCRLERSRQWAIRCVHEASLHPQNTFITLTYNPENLPEDNSLNKKHFQDFIKRLRKSIEPKKIRYFHCGEYGEQKQRPHYHAIIFNHDFSDKTVWKEKKDYKVYTSITLEKLWGKGFVSIGEVNFETAAYTARYIMKKVTGKNADDHYTNIHPLTGDISILQPEYTTMSRRPGIAKGWYDLYQSDVYPSDFITIRGQKLKPPKFYDSQIEKELEQEYLKIKDARRKKAFKNRKDSTPERLITREVVKKAQVTKLKREI